MGRWFVFLALAACASSALASDMTQQGTIGRGDASIDQRISTWLNGDELKEVLTPGETGDWKQTLKAGQVVIAEARSDAFDPVLQIVKDGDKTGTPLTENDDRYPGDQRPLIIWRCPEAGDYDIRVRCLKNNFGGPFFVRARIYDSIDVAPGQIANAGFSRGTQFLMRLSAKKGQIVRFVSNQGSRDLDYHVDAAISPEGLPDIDLARQINPIIHGWMAPMDGTYYMLATAWDDSGVIHAGVQEVAPTVLNKANAFTSKSPTNTPDLWQVDVEAGQLLEVDTPELQGNGNLIVAEVPDIHEFGTDKGQIDAFKPRPPDHPAPNLGQAFDILPGRARDNRRVVIFVRRNATLWLASDGGVRQNSEFTMRVKPAASGFAADETSQGNLKIGNYDYWSFDAQSGDVMTLASATPNFVEAVVVRGPDIQPIRNTVNGLDQTSDTWKMVIQQPGRYTVCVSCMGDGGGGAYTLSRKVLHASDFKLGEPAKGRIVDGQVSVWKFTASPSEPLLIHWQSTAWNYDVQIYNERGEPVDFQRDAVDSNNRFGILKVGQPQTYVIVLTGHGNADYSIDLGHIPGYGK